MIKGIKRGFFQRRKANELRQKYCYPGGGSKSGQRIRCDRSRVTVVGMDKNMNRSTGVEVLEKLRRRYKTAGAQHKGKLLDQEGQLLGYHRKGAIRALHQPRKEGGPLVLTGRPVK